MDKDSIRQKRQHLLSTLSKSKTESIQEYWNKIALEPSYQFLKKPEIGMAMVKAKAGGTGNDFNMGEMTVTRSVVILKSKEVGYGYTAGRDKNKSTLIALIDACFQVLKWEKLITQRILEPLLETLEQQHVKEQEKVDKTKVNFFTMVRGEN